MSEKSCKSLWLLTRNNAQHTNQIVFLFLYLFGFAYIDHADSPDVDENPREVVDLMHTISRFDTTSQHSIDLCIGYAI